MIFDILEEPADAFEILEGGRILDEIGLAAHDQHLVVGIGAARPGGDAGLDDAGGNIVELALEALQIIAHEALHFAQGLALETRRQIIGCLDQGGGRQAGRHFDGAVLDAAVLADQNDQRAAGPKIDEFDMLQPGIELGRQDDAGAMGEAGEQRRRLRPAHPRHGAGGWRRRPGHRCGRARRA